MSPPTSRAAHVREGVLLTLPVGDLVSLGLTLRSEHSSAGEAASGFMADSPNDPSVTRSYAHAAEPLQLCEAIRAELARVGWAEPDYGDGACETSGDTTTARLQRSCSAFDARVEIRVGSATAAYDPAGAQVVISSAYPEDPRVDPYVAAIPDIHAEDDPTTTTTAITC